MGGGRCKDGSDSACESAREDLREWALPYRELEDMLVAAYAVCSDSGLVQRCWKERKLLHGRRQPFELWTSLAEARTFLVAIFTSNFHSKEVTGLGLECSKVNELVTLQCSAHGRMSAVTVTRREDSISHVYVNTSVPTKCSSLDPASGSSSFVIPPSLSDDILELK